MDLAGNTAMHPVKTFIDRRLIPCILILMPVSFLAPSFKVFNVLAILLTLAWLIKGNLRARIRLAFTNRFTLLFCGIYVLFVVGLLYTENLRAGLFLLEKKLPLLIFPIVLSTENVSGSLLKNILFAFVVSCIIATFVSLFGVDFKYLGEYYWIAVDLFRDSFKSLLQLDPPYFGLFITFSIIITAFYALSEWNVMRTAWKIAAIICLAFLIVIDLLLSARMSLIALFLLGGVIYVYLLIKNKTFRIPGTILIIVVLLAFGFAFTKFSFINKRFEELVTTEWKPPVGVYHNSTNLRIGILHCTSDLLRENWMFGLGTGSVQQNLNACYKIKGYSDVMYIDQYNTHSEYFNVWLNVGLPGLAILLMAFFIPLKVAFSRGYFLYLAFLALMILSCMTESVFERQKGIVFYAFFNSLFAFNSLGVTRKSNELPSSAKNN